MKSQLQKNFGNRVRELRNQRGWSQEEFAERCGVDRTYISGIERGVRNPTLIVINEISSGFGIEMSELFKKVNSTI